MRSRVVNGVEVRGRRNDQGLTGFGNAGEPLTCVVRADNASQPRQLLRHSNLSVNRVERTEASNSAVESPQIRLQHTTKAKMLDSAMRSRVIDIHRVAQRVW